MSTEAQRQAARRNIRKAQKAWKRMGPTARARSQPEGPSRAKPGTQGGGSYYHVAVRSKRGYDAFRTQDVGRKGHAQRVAGHRPGGSWSTVKWLISKDDAHVEGSRLVADTASARKILRQLGSAPRHDRGDRFTARPQPNVPESAKPTAAMRRARRTSLRKARKARHAR